MSVGFGGFGVILRQTKLKNDTIMFDIYNPTQMTPQESDQYKDLTDEERIYLSELYEKYARMLFVCSYSITRQAPDPVALAQECMQETFEKAMLKIHVLQSHPNVRIGAVEIGGIEKAHAALVGVDQQPRAFFRRQVLLQRGHRQRAEAQSGNLQAGTAQRRHLHRVRFQALA